MSCDSGHSLTPSKPGAGNSFAFPNSLTFHCASLTPAPSTSGSQHVTSSGWHPQVPLSPLHLQGLDPLTMDQAAKLYQLATECQALGSDLAKRFHTLCSLEATHCAIAQSTAHEMVLSGCHACSTAYGLATATQSVPERELTLCRLCEAANKAWKDANDVLFSHLLQYNVELASFISSTEDALRTNEKTFGGVSTTCWGQPTAPPNLPVDVTTDPSMAAQYPVGPLLPCRCPFNVNLWPRSVQAPSLRWHREWQIQSRH